MGGAVAQDDGDDGPGTGLTASPSLIDDDPLASPALQHPQADNHLLHHHPSSPLPVSPVVTQTIDARQRSRTMDSLDEEDGADGFVLLNPNLVRPSPLARHSTDGSTPTASILGIDMSEKEKKQKRRRSFLPRIGRSNSQQSTGAGSGGESTGTEDDLPSPGLVVPSGLPGGASGAPSLRRGILRRNSSRKAADLAIGMGGALGAASTFAIDDEEYES